MRIKICEEHTYKVPLIWTFKFIGAEYWCPYCGYTGGMFGAGVDVKKTPELKERLEIYKKASKKFLASDGLKGWKYKQRASKLN